VCVCVCVWDCTSEQDGWAGEGHSCRLGVISNAPHRPGVSPLLPVAAAAVLVEMHREARVLQRKSRPPGAPHHGCVDVCRQARMAQDRRSSIANRGSSVWCLLLSAWRGCANYSCKQPAAAAAAAQVPLASGMGTCRVSGRSPFACNSRTQLLAGRQQACMTDSAHTRRAASQGVWRVGGCRLGCVEVYTEHVHSRRTAMHAQ
jgi:hypothetical protein